MYISIYTLTRCIIFIYKQEIELFHYHFSKQNQCIIQFEIKLFLLLFFSVSISYSGSHVYIKNNRSFLVFFFNRNLYLLKEFAESFVIVWFLLLLICRNIYNTHSVVIFSNICFDLCNKQKRKFFSFISLLFIMLIRIFYSHSQY